jgi:hypothetical protein
MSTTSTDVVGTDTPTTRIRKSKTWTNYILFTPWKEMMVVRNPKMFKHYWTGVEL